MKKWLITSLVLGTFLLKGNTTYAQVSDSFTSNSEKIEVNVLYNAYDENFIKAHDLESNDTWQLQNHEEYGIVYYNTDNDEMLINPFILDSQGNPIYLDLNSGEEFIEAKKISYDIKGNSISPIPKASTYYTYTANYSYPQYANYRYRLTPYIQNGLSVTYVNTVTFSDSYTGNLSGSASIKKLIQINAGFSWNRTATTSKQIGIGMINNSGKTAALGITPLYNVTAGPVYYYDTIKGTKTYKGNHISKSPAKIGEFADGIYGWLYLN